MKQVVLGLLFFAHSAFALNISIENGKTQIHGPESLTIYDVKVGGIATPVAIDLVWSSVENVFRLADIHQNVSANFAGVWETTIQNECTGAFSAYTTMELLQNGTCSDRGMKCSWSANNGTAEIKWTDYPQYIITAKLVNGELDGLITQTGTTAKWCWKGIRKGNIFDTLAKVPNFNSIPFVR